MSSPLHPEALAFAGELDRYLRQRRGLGRRTLSGMPAEYLLKELQNWSQVLYGRAEIGGPQTGELVLEAAVRIALLAVTLAADEAKR